ncbi:hypothetical protein NBRC10513v2_000820 [Rhodotorula toruloides]|uniref:Uncharacterized protein n=1 Tax=Rhodotorula toruloides TaxID=5286 RepID=A0A2T0A4G3_RHOTO|nr:hypothetical protein AAT19DRAFT_16831 [Rhodotorula toruloides]
MATAALAMVHDAAVEVQSAEEAQRDFLLQGVFIHPDHLAQGFFADECTDYSSSSGSSSLLSYDDEEDVPTNGLSGLALECTFSSAQQEETRDYFASRQVFTNTSPFAPSTPLAETQQQSPSFSDAFPLAPTFSRRSSCMSVASDAPMSPAMPATFSFATFAAPSSRPSTRAPSPVRAHPYVRPTGADMMRSVSSPVETQRQLEERQRRMSTAENVMDVRAIKMARSKSTASTPTGEAFSSGASMARSSGKLFSPLASTFGEDWGKTLPPRESEAPPLVPFPYNVARPPVSPTRNARSHSFAGRENVYIAPAHHRNSIHCIIPPSTSSGAPSPPSPTMPRHARRASRMSIAPLTPILPQSPELHPIDEMTCAMQATAAYVPSTASPVRNRLQRGMTF